MKEDKTHLTAAEVQDAITALEGWHQDGLFIQKTFAFDSYKDINLFLPHLAASIAGQNHHPDFSFDSGARSVAVRMTTHSAGGITQADINLATALNNWRSV